MKTIQRLFELQELEMGPKAEAPEARRAAETVRKDIPETILAHYDRLRLRGKKGVAIVRHSVCTGCQMKLASGVYAKLLRDDDIGICDTCGRYLLLGADEFPGVPGAQPVTPVAAPIARKRRRKVPVDAAV